MRILFVPKSLICSLASRLAPSPMDIMERTAATPKTIPSVLRSERSLRRSKPLTPMLRLSDHCNTAVLLRLPKPQPRPGSSNR